MTERLWCSYFDGVGTPLTLVIEPNGGSGPPTFRPDVAGISTTKFKRTLKYAFRETLAAIGWPAKTSFYVYFEPITPAFPIPGLFDGDSLFGALWLGLAQGVARVEPACVRYAARPLLPMLRAVRLERVAVTAGYDGSTRRFAPVGCIGDKLESFCFPDFEGPVVCVVAINQNLTELSTQTEDHPGRYRYIPQNGGRPLPVLKTYDAMDALTALWVGQARALADRI